MDVEDAGRKPDPQELEPRPPVERDLAHLCRRLNEQRTRYVVVGGFAMMLAGHARTTVDIVEIREVQGVPIPFASPRLLWRMKADTHRAKDAPDLVFLRHWFESRGESPPAV